MAESSTQLPTALRLVRRPKLFDGSRARETLLRARFDLHKLDFQMPKHRASSFNQTTLEAAVVCQRWHGTAQALGRSCRLESSTPQTLNAEEETQGGVDHWNTNLRHQYSTLPPPKPVLQLNGGATINS